MERLLFSMMNEAFKVLEDGICQKPEEIDMLWLVSYVAEAVPGIRGMMDKFVQSNLCIKTTLGKEQNWSLFTGGLYSQGHLCSNCDIGKW